MKRIEVCHLNGASNKVEELKDWLQTSKSRIKKLMTKKELDKKILKAETLSLPINLVNQGMINPEYVGEKVEIISETEELIILNKPSKIHMHPLSYDESDNLLSFLNSIGKGAHLIVNNKNYDRGLLFRLDYETSGVCYYAKNDDLYEKVRASFNNVSKLKEYYAIVEGEFNLTGELVDLMEGSLENNHKMKYGPDGKEARLYATLEKYDEVKNLSLVKISLKTGLRHQIRFQLSTRGYPILGDELYGGKSAERLYLHAFCYEIEIEEKKYSFKAALPKLFTDLFNLN